jgi:hypothetical protein
MTLEDRFMLAEAEGGRLGPLPVTPAEPAGRVSERLAEKLVHANLLYEYLADILVQSAYSGV